MEDWASITQFTSSSITCRACDRHCSNPGRMECDNPGNLHPGSYTRLEHRMIRHNGVSPLPERNEWHAVLLVSFYTVTLEASLQFGDITPWQGCFFLGPHPHHLPKMSWLLISHRMSGRPAPSWSAYICQVTSITAATLLHS